MKRHALNIKVVSALFSVLVLSGCGLDSGSSVTSNDSGGMGAPSVVENPGLVAGDGVTTTEKSIIRTGDLTLKTGNVSKTFDDVKSAVIAAGGRVESSSYNAAADYSGPSAYITARLPESKLDTAIATISTLATRTSLNLSTSDVTLQTVDLKAKIQALTTSRDRLLALMAKATNTADLIAAESALAQRQSDLDSLQSQLDYLTLQVSESTLNIQVITDATSMTSGLRGFKATIVQTVRNFLQAFESVFIFIGSAIPWVLILGGLYALSRSVMRRLHGRNQVAPSTKNKDNVAKDA